ncbi:SNF2-related protein [Citrobacter sp. S2-9]|uniref:SNF2-related protein n=1 Tax=Citrobacter enshiensis TaxID=2971264 RepID=A0ABT8PVW6_9ENTR|nr:SNF2-related protein [Citrobacter enshiensis]MDN8600290.1 SNF2-related protein [Citrobacter enshiensis]
MTTVQSSPSASSPAVFPLSQFIDEFGDSLLDSLNHSLPPVYDGTPDTRRQAVMDGLKRRPFAAQADVVQTVAKLLVDRNEPSAIVNGEMGCGKTLLAIATAAVLYHEGYRRTLVLSPPHLVYKWRREIQQTVPDARVWVLNGPDTLLKLITLRDQLHLAATGPEFFILGRVRMRMGYHWKPAFAVRRQGNFVFAVCPDCGQRITDTDGNWLMASLISHEETPRKCTHCKTPLWTLIRPQTISGDLQGQMVGKALKRIPTIGEATAKKLTATFGTDFLASMLGDNLYDFINLMDGDGELVFSDRQAGRMERAMANMEFGFGEGNYQASEYVKRYLPKGTFDLMVVDEAHEYKGGSSAQGQAMGVLASGVRKTLLLTGTLMGGYADDIFFLLFRILTRQMLEDGYRPGRNGSLNAAAMQFMRDHGVLKEVFSESNDEAHKTAKGKKSTVRVSKAPGFGPKGVLRCLLPYTVFLKLSDLGSGILPPYREEFREVAMTNEQAVVYQELTGKLTALLRQALAKRDTTLMGVVLNVLLAWPECCFRQETVKHPRTRQVLACVPSLFKEMQATPKEQELTDICLEEKAAGRKVLAYSTYSGTRDTTSRLKALLMRAGLKVAVLRATVSPEQREDWVADQVDRGIDVIVTNPELVKTGLDLLEFPTIIFLQTGFNVYTLLQAARRSWRIGQQQDVRVIFLGYTGTSQMACLDLMARKIAVAQSTAGDVPESGLDILNSDGDSVEIALAKQLLTA